MNLRDFVTKARFLRIQVRGVSLILLLFFLGLVLMHGYKRHEEIALFLQEHGFISISHEFNFSKIEFSDQIAPEIKVQNSSDSIYLDNAVLSLWSREKLNFNSSVSFFQFQTENQHEVYYEVLAKYINPGSYKYKVEVQDKFGNSSSKTFDIKRIEKYDQNIDLGLIEPNLDVIIISNLMFPVVNQVYRLPASYKPNDLVSLDDSGIRNFFGGYLRKEVALAYKDMQDILDTEGIDIKVTSAFRSFQSQAYTYNYIKATRGKKEVDQIAAKPGHSEHQLGLAVDVVNIETNNRLPYPGQKTKLYSWLAENSYKYGFVQTYDGSDAQIMTEPWHIRYVGKELAKRIHQSGQSPIEFLLSEKGQE